MKVDFCFNLEKKRFFTKIPDWYQNLGEETLALCSLCYTLGASCFCFPIRDKSSSGSTPSSIWFSSDSSDVSWYSADDGCTVQDPHKEWKGFSKAV